MRNSTRRLFRINGVTITAAHQNEVIDAVLAKVTAGKSFYICTLNLDHLVKLETDLEFRRIYAAADIVTADGFPIVYLARREGVALERTTGSDLVDPLSAAAAAHGIPVFFVGTTEKTLDACIGFLRAQWPGLNVVGAIAPPFGFDPVGPAAREISQQIAQSGARLCFVGLGSPKQEIFAATAVTALEGVGFIPIGAGLEFIAKTKSRAPVWIQRMGCEWLWRLAAEPRRLMPRYFKSATLFMRVYLRRSFEVIQ